MAAKANEASLRAEVAELRASRRRLVAAADAERRRIERDLHDGAQQHLVALAVSVQLARQVADTDPAALKTLLEEIGRDVTDALEAVRDLACGIYPPLLTDRGLGEALAAAASAARIPTRVEAPALERYPAEVEATAYFFCVEALHDAAAAAGPGGRAIVRVWPAEDELRLEVEHDSAGASRGPTPPESALTSTSDRLCALGGWLTITTKPGGGTVVGGTIPLAPSVHYSPSAR